MEVHMAHRSSQISKELLCVLCVLCGVFLEFRFYDVCRYTLKRNLCTGVLVRFFPIFPLYAHARHRVHKVHKNRFKLWEKIPPRAGALPSREN